MPIEQMNISLPPKMARFIRAKVKAGNYTDASEVVRDAIRQMQDLDVAKKSHGQAESDLLTHDHLTGDQKKRVTQSVQRGVMDYEEGRYQEFDEAGLKRHFADIGKRGKKRLATLLGL